MDTFNIYYNKAYQSSIEFKTQITNEYLPNEQRNSLWSNELSNWTLQFEKTPEAFSELKAFFIAQKGKGKAFYWTWAINKGGDGKQYKVRFDTDKLDSAIQVVNQNGYATFNLKIVEVK